MNMVLQYTFGRASHQSEYQMNDSSNLLKLWLFWKLRVEKVCSI